MPNRDPNKHTSSHHADDVFAQSVLLSEASLRAHWRALVPWLDEGTRFRLLAALRTTEQAIEAAAEGCER